MQSPVITYGMALYTNDSIPTKQWHLENLWICERARSERAWKILHFHILKLLFPSIFCWYFWYFFSETYVFSGLKLQSVWSSMQFPVITNGMALYKRQYNDQTLSLRKFMNMRASELGNFLHFHILKLLFPSIVCWYFWYFISETYLYRVAQKECTTLIVNFKNIVDEMEMFLFVFWYRTFLFQQNDTMHDH